MSALKETSMFWIGISIIISIIGMWLRAWRWKLLIEAGKDIQIPTVRVFWGLLIGYLTNLVLPRAGELIRCSIIKKTDGIPVGNLLGTVLVERTIDLMFLMVTIVLAFIIESDLFLRLFSQLISADSLLEEFSWVIPFIFGVFILLSILVYILYKFYRERNLIKKMRHFIRDLIYGLKSLLNVQNQTGFWLSSIATWIIYYFTMYFVAIAIPSTANLSPSAVLMVMVMGSIGMVAPVQGGIGTFHAMVAFILMAYGLTDEEGKIFAVIIHGSQTFTVIALGVVALLLFLKFTIKQEPKFS